jgi:hypothetical protein
MYSYQSSTGYTLIWVMNSTHNVRFNYVFVDNNQYYEID